MEQTNLIVSPDGKTWDEVTRDTSYLGASTRLDIQADETGTTNGIIIYTMHRGGATTNHHRNKINKGFAYGYDRVIILEDGLYDVRFQLYSNVADVDFTLKINNADNDFDNPITHVRVDPADHTTESGGILNLKRGDYIVCKASNAVNNNSMILSIIKIKS